MRNRDDLHVYQNRSGAHIKNNDNCAIWADVGLGKTVSTLTAYADLVKSYDARRALVVAPLRVARRVWSDEVEQWSHLQSLHVERILGDAGQRMNALGTKADIHTINRENLPWLEAQFIQHRRQIRRWPWDLVIVDESQSLKNPSAQRYKAMRRLRKLFPRMVQLSATPMPNGYEDLWAQIYLLDQGHRLGKTQGEFKRRFFDPPGYFNMFAKWTIKTNAAEEISAALKDIVLVLREEDLLKDLPPVQNNFIRVSLSPKELETYRKLEREAIIKFGGKKITAVNAGVLWGKLLQYANGAVYYEDQKYHEFHKRKLEALWELLEELPKPVMIGYSFIHDMERVMKQAPKSLGRFDILKTDRSFEDWRKGKIDYGLIHPASAGHGLNDLYVSGSENIVWFGFTNNLEFYLQLNGRLTGGHRRVGKHVVIHHIVADRTIDEDALELLDYKRGQQDTLKANQVQRMLYRL